MKYLPHLETFESACPLDNTMFSCRCGIVRLLYVGAWHTRSVRH